MSEEHRHPGSGEGASTEAGDGTEAGKAMVRTDIPFDKKAAEAVTHHLYFAPCVRYHQYEMITVTPLGQSLDQAGSSAVQTSASSSASGSATQPRALCYLIRIDASYLLLDCGAPEDLRFPSKSSGETRSSLNDYELADGSLNTQSLAALPLDEAVALLAPRIQLVLLSHSTLHHTGLYAYARARLGLQCPAYATLPTSSMGRLTTLEAAASIAAECDLTALDKRPPVVSKRKTADVASKLKSENDGATISVKQEDDEPATSVAQEVRDRCVPTRLEIDEAFESLRTLRYLQPTILEGSLSSLSLTAHSAGHTLGGTVWKIRSPTSGTVVLAIDWNHVRERHIDGSGVIEGAAAASSPSSGPGGIGSNTANRAAEEAAGTKRAEMLVTSGERLNSVNARRKDKDKRLLDLVHHTLTVSKSTLHLPLDASSRLLELLVLLDQHWAYSYPHARFPLCLVSRTGKEVIERARTMREWMGRQLQGEEQTTKGSNDNKGRGQPQQIDNGILEFRFLRIFTSLSALSAAVPSGSAKVVITVGPSLLYGPSLRFFQEHVAGGKDNAVVLTQQTQQGSLGATMRAWWQKHQDAGWTERTVGKEVDGSGCSIEGLTVRSKVPLQGLELEEHLERERARTQREEQQKAMLARSRKRLEADQEADEGDDEGDMDDEGSSEGESDDELAGVEGVGSKRNRELDMAGEGANGGTGQLEAQDGPGDVISHDVFLRGAAARTTNFFGSQQGHRGREHDDEREREAMERHGVGLRFRTFPVVEKRKRVDAYGEVIDVARWLSRGRREREEEEEQRRTASGADGGDAANKRRKVARDRTGGYEDGYGDQGDEDGGEGEVDELQGAPSKFIVEQIDLAISCRILCVDLEGLIDGRALSIVLPQLAPRRLLLVNAPQPLSTPNAAAAEDTVAEKSKAHNAAKETPTGRFISSLLAVRDFTREIFAPALGACVSVGAEVKSYDVRLGEGVLEGIEMGSYEEWSLGWVKGRVGKMTEGEEGKDSTVVMLEKAVGAAANAAAAISDEDAQDDADVAAAADEIAEQERSDLSIYDRPSNDTSTSSLSTLFIGDVRLSKLKALLSATNYRIPAEFGGSGLLVCGQAALSALGVNAAGGGSSANAIATANQASAAVTVQKQGDGIVLEGNAGRTFVRVREAVYAMHAKVARN